MVGVLIMAKRIKYLINELQKDLKGMTVKLSFKFQKVKFLDNKTAEIYKNIYYDIITKDYFAVIKEAKYSDGSDVFRASIDFQRDAYKVEDYDYKRADDFAGIVASFSTLKEADKFLKKQVDKYFVYKLREENLSDLGADTLVTFRNKKRK